MENKEIKEQTYRYKYKCWNPKCPYYAGYNYIIKSQRKLETCPYCGKKSLELLSGEPAKGIKTLAGVAGGTLLGWTIGGPAGAFIGGIIGLIIGAESEGGKEVKGKENE